MNGFETETREFPHHFTLLAPLVVRHTLATMSTGLIAIAKGHKASTILNGCLWFDAQTVIFHFHLQPFKDSKSVHASSGQPNF